MIDIWPIMNLDPFSRFCLSGSPVWPTHRHQSDMHTTTKHA